MRALERDRDRDTETDKADNDTYVVRERKM